MPLSDAFLILCVSICSRKRAINQRRLPQSVMWWMHVQYENVPKRREHQSDSRSSVSAVLANIFYRTVQNSLLCHPHWIPCWRLRAHQIQGPRVWSLFETWLWVTCLVEKDSAVFNFLELFDWHDCLSSAMSWPTVHFIVAMTTAAY